MQTSPNEERPAFELESYDDTSLPQGKQLHHDGELHGHALPTVTAWLAGITLALVIAASINLDIDDHSAEVAQAADIEHAHQAAEARQRFARAAQAMCGPQSPWSEPAPGVVQCHNKHGRKTVIAQGVTP